MTKSLEWYWDMFELRSRDWKMYQIKFVYMKNDLSKVQANYYLLIQSISPLQTEMLG